MQYPVCGPHTPACAQKATQAATYDRSSFGVSNHRANRQAKNAADHSPR